MAEASVKQRGHDKLCIFLSNRPDSVHKNPDNEYQKFINAFVFLNSNLRRQEALTKGQELWRSRPHSIQSGTVSPQIDIIFQQAIEKMKGYAKQGTLKAFFKPLQKVRTTVGVLINIYVAVNPNQILH